MPSEYMMALGGYRFSLATAAYRELSRSTAYRWPAQQRLGRLPARQYLGPGDDTLTLNGVLYPEYKGGLGQLDRLREEAGSGAPLLLTGGDGRIHGRWAITRVEETHRALEADGAPRKIEFRLELARYGEDKPAGGDDR